MLVNPGLQICPKVGIKVVNPKISAERPYESGFIHAIPEVDWRSMRRQNTPQGVRQNPQQKQQVTQRKA
jgi:hypothetical protein